MTQSFDEVPEPPVKKRSKVGCGCLGAVAVIVAIGAVAAIADGNRSNTASSSDTATGSQAGSTDTGAATRPAQPKARTLLRLAGNGIKNSAQFTTGGQWTLAYTYNCAGFGGKGNFAVSDETGMPLVNELDTKGSGSTPQYTAGTHHLEVDSECAWTLTVTG